MKKESKTYLCIDLKSYYASVECVERGLDPLTTNLVVADESRTDKTICLAVSPALKAYGISGRARLFEVKQRLREIKNLTGEDVHFIIAPPQMAKYLQVSSEIYEIYLNYLSPADIHTYSIDEVFMDVTSYLNLYHMTARELAVTMIRDVLSTVGITATAGIGSNLYLAKIAMDIVAKHIPTDRDGVRVAELDERGFREKLWGHVPLTDFWGIGPGISRHLEKMGIHTMGDLARFSLHSQEILFREFGVDAEILIDHAWGIEPCGMEHIKQYKPSIESISSGQVLKRGYSFDEGRIVVREMAEQVILDMIDQGYQTEGATLYVGYEAMGKENASYSGPISVNHYGQRVPSSVHGTANLGAPTASQKRVVNAVLGLYDKLVNRRLQVRRMNVAVIRLSKEEDNYTQIDLFSDHTGEKRETDILKTTLALQKRFGKSALFKGHDLMDAATTLERNGQIGGHKA